MTISVGKTVIIVEDEPDTAEMFAEMVRLTGLQVLKSLGGVRAIDLIAEKKPAAVLLDIMMPDVSGLEVLRFMHRDPRLSKIPVIIVSAKSLPSEAEIQRSQTRSFGRPNCSSTFLRIATRRRALKLPDW